LVGKELDLPKAELIEGEFFIVLPPDEIHGYSTLVTVGVFSGDKLLDKVRASFVGPMTRGQRK
jgi:hypothetical protein